MEAWSSPNAKLADCGGLLYLGPGGEVGSCKNPFFFLPCFEAKAKPRVGADAWRAGLSKECRRRRCRPHNCGTWGGIFTPLLPHALISLPLLLPGPTLIVFPRSSHLVFHSTPIPNSCLIYHVKLVKVPFPNWPAKFLLET